MDYTADTPLVSAPGEAPFELFNTDGSFDLDGGFVIFRPDDSGGFDVCFIPPQQGLGTATLEGTVLDAGGQPLSDCEVLLRGSQGQSRRVLTAGDGGFRFEGLSTGVLYSVEAYDRGTLVGRGHVRLREPAQATALTLKPLLEEGTGGSGSLRVKLLKQPPPPPR